MDKQIVTAENIDYVRASVAACDQARELVVGCETWGIIYAGGQRGQMTRWPDGRGAVSWGSDSCWGDWDGNVLFLDDGGVRVTDDGEEAEEEDDDDEYGEEADAESAGTMTVFAKSCVCNFGERWAQGWVEEEEAAQEAAAAVEAAAIVEWYDRQLVADVAAAAREDRRR